MAVALEVDSVGMSYGALQVLKNVSFRGEQGEIFAIIGPNGAGKTTLFKAMTGEALCNAGRVRFFGEDVTRLPAHARVRMGMGRTFQVARVFLDFTVRENIEVAIEARRRNAHVRVDRLFSIRPPREIAEEARELIVQLGLGPVMHQQASLLSHGDKKRLEFLIALALKPKALMLDEPMAGVSPGDRQSIAKLIRDINTKYGITVFMTEHDMEIIFGLANRILVLNYGEVVAIGTVGEIRNNAAIKEVYLGKESHGA